MPELPEVETTVRGLKEKVLERTFIDVWSNWHKLIKKPESFELFKSQIKNKKIIKIWRRAKNVIFDLSDGYSLLVHQKLTGHLLYGKWILKEKIWVPEENGPLNDPYNRFLHLIFFLDNGKMVALSDARKFAKVELQKTAEFLEEFKELGPEPLEFSFTLEKFKEILKGPKGHPKGKIKQVLMDPEVVAGIGNIYASEILWWAKIHPEKKVQDLGDAEITLIYKYIKKVLTAGVELGGESFSDYRKTDGSKGNFDSEKVAYKREGQKCSRCGEKIKRTHFGGRSAFFCPHCQKL